MNLEHIISSAANIIYFLIVLGLAVVFHEWGHFIVAKLAGAKVDRFAVGFGKTLCSFTWHETEYAVCALPLGGYVKIRGMDPDEESTGAVYEFLELPPWKRIFIVVAGPLMNFVLALLIYIFLLGYFGQPYIGTTTIGNVPFGSAAWEIGLREGDKILKINDVAVSTWDEVEDNLSYEKYQNPKTLKMVRSKISLAVERNGQILNKEKTLPASIFSVTDETKTTKQEKAKSAANYQGILITNVLPGGAAEKAGLKPGTVISQIDGKSFENRNDWSDYISSRYEQQTDGSIKPVPLNATCVLPEGTTTAISIVPEIITPATDALPLRPKAKIDIAFDAEITVKEYFTSGSPFLGFSPKLKPVVGNVMEGGPAYTAGLRTGYQIVELDGKPIDDWYKVLTSIQDSLIKSETEESKAKAISFTWLTTDNKMVQQSITPQVSFQNLLTPTSTKTGKRYAIAQIGIDRQYDRKKMGLIGSITGGWDKLVNISESMLYFMGRLFSGDISPKLLGGPIAIFQLSAETGRWGVERFLGFIALLSANLGLLNLFPFPPLDGGHVVFYTYEIVLRKRLTMKHMENFGKLGFLLIIPLMIWVIFNDLDRLNFFSWIFRWFR